MLGNCSNERSEVLPRRGSLTRSCVCEAGLQSQNNSNNQKTNSRQMLVNCGHPCRKLLTFKAFWGRHGKLVAHFKKNKTVKCSSYLCVLLLQMVSPQGGMWACVWLRTPVWVRTCFQMPPGSSAFPFAKDGVWHPESGSRFEVPLWGGRAGWGRERTVIDSDVQWSDKMRAE